MAKQVEMDPRIILNRALQMIPRGYLHDEQIAVAAEWLGKLPVIIAELNAQPATDEQATWKPLPDGIYRDPINANGVVVRGHALRTFNDYDAGVEVHLSDNSRLCLLTKRTTAAQGVANTG